MVNMVAALVNHDIRHGHLHKAYKHSPDSGLSQSATQRLYDALAFARPHLEHQTINTGQNASTFCDDVLRVLASLKTDVDTRIAAIIFELPLMTADIEERFGKEVTRLVTGTRQLMHLHGLSLTQTQSQLPAYSTQSATNATEILRKMLLAMATDVRVVLIRLVLRVVGLQYFSENKVETNFSRQYAQETLEVYAPLANRLGIWQLKWALEDLSFRFIDPVTYKRIAHMLFETRVARERFIEQATTRLQTTLTGADIVAQVSGRPKHIYSIWKKMRSKELDFSEVQDVRAFRVIVENVRLCYTVLGVIHHLWAPVANTFDDYIARPKPNGYQSLHTVVIAEDKRPLEVQIRTHAMHQFAEVGMAAHWRYKESSQSTPNTVGYDEKIAWLRQLLAWKSDLATARQVHFNDRIYVLTPRAHIIELPAGATPIDFAYHLHTNIGHRCRGARVDNLMVPINTPLKNGQTVHILTAPPHLMPAGPSRDWLTCGYIVSQRARCKIRTWFNSLERQDTCDTVTKLPAKLGSHRKPPEVNHIANPITLGTSAVFPSPASSMLVVGTKGIFTTLAGCCKPIPPDATMGFTTKGRGISIHRTTCKGFIKMATCWPERILQTTWGRQNANIRYPVNILVFAHERLGLLQDISEIFSKEKIPVTVTHHVKSAKGQTINQAAITRMIFCVKVTTADELKKIMNALKIVSGVVDAKRE